MTRPNGIRDLLWVVLQEVVIRQQQIHVCGGCGGCAAEARALSVACSRSPGKIDGAEPSGSILGVAPSSGCGAWNGGVAFKSLYTVRYPALFLSPGYLFYPAANQSIAGSFARSSKTGDNSV